MLSFTDWLTVFLIGSLAIISPGPDFTIILRNSLAYSRAAGAYTAVGITAGIFVHVTYTLIGIGAIISRSIVLFSIIKWLGAAYLIYIGIKSLRAKKHTASVTNGRRTRDMGGIAAFRSGFLTNLLNPKATLFFLALFTQIIHPETALPVQVLYGLTIAISAWAWFTLVSILISSPMVKNRFVAVSHWIERVMGALLVSLGLRLALARENN